MYLLQSVVLGIVVAGYLGSIPLMLVFTVLTSLGEGPWQGDVGAVIATVQSIHILRLVRELMGLCFVYIFGYKAWWWYWCSTSGWLLDARRSMLIMSCSVSKLYSMMNVMYLWLPFAF